MKKALALRYFLMLAVLLWVSCKSDDDGDSYVPITINANADAGEVYQNAIIEINIFSNDTNVPSDGILTLSNPQTGTVTQIDPNNTESILDDLVQYTPDASFTGQDTFQYTVCDATGQSCATGTVTINVLPFSPVEIDLSLVPYPKLSDYHFFEGALADQDPVFGVLPYEPISALFTDYAHKKRFVWMPSNVKASYVGDGELLNFPTSTILIKTFYYENVLPNNTTKIIETRLLIKKEEGWLLVDYVWNEEQNEAYLDTTGNGANVPFEWIQNGETKFVNYRIPSDSQCYTCHKAFKQNMPIGLKPQSLNGMYNYSEGSENQLEKWIQMGYLEDNLPGTINTVVNWADTSQPLDLRVRSYFDINCASCHSDSGHCDYRALRMAFSLTEDPANMGVCVNPDTPIPGYEGSKMIIPGDAQNSIVYFRLHTTDEEYRMPLLGRTIRHDEAVSFIEEWINSLTDNCD